ncbi:MAG: hypothetical protein A2639_00505 [Candidatus Staskawiczbacteria bacterium RIFCSPHIGHO2_01_FULL_34_27]|uniref:RNA-binding protein n=1 Tax=Candidatus Staskawiczbacteria bacterium RIFCSPHIGHO2_01_FULL_34_27 TaxID=1802199 RepID=A0A1G2HJF2_9BACT|nr:exosome complex protein Rrp42 [Candidatus Pacearchaeota archaeon]OGZ62549.1 MAG: hypothetical protein A2639_00505 [Candidatus Staskawiczbacteria bacterium RIFCSPHIGHO2_01_FULL_34_27]
METTKVTAERIKEYLESGKRFDGRKPDEFREISIETGVSKNAEGSVRVKIGKTDVIAGVKMEVSEPYPDSPDKGNLVVSAELLPMSSSRYEAGPPKIEAIELARVTDRIVRESKFIDMEELCITKGEKVWTVYIDIYSINADGNLLDAAGLAAIAALRIAKMPKYDKKEEKIIRGEFTDKNIPLKKETPISITIYKIGNSLIVDPNIEEEDVSEARITIGFCDGKISSMQKGDPKEISIEEMTSALDITKKLWKKIADKLEEELEKAK